MVPELRQMGGNRNTPVFLKPIGFEHGEATPCVFVHNSRNLTSVHGDDFTTVGSKSELDWLEAKLGGQ